MRATLKINTARKVDFVDLSGQVQQVVSSAGIKGGICLVFVPHTTAGITLNENADPAVLSDIAGRLGNLVPENAGYRHSEANSPAHIKASLFGHSETLLVEEGRIMLGTWQGIFLAEFDGPRERSVLVKVIPDSR